MVTKDDLSTTTKSVMRKTTKMVKLRSEKITGEFNCVLRSPIVP